MISNKCIPQILVLFLTKSGTIFLGKRWLGLPIRSSAIQRLLWNTNSIREAVISITTPSDNKCQFGDRLDLPSRLFYIIIFDPFSILILLIALVVDLDELYSVFN